MYSQAQIEALELLDKYFSETAESIIKADIDAITQLSFVGSSAKDYFSLFHKHLNYEPFGKELEISKAKIAPKYPTHYSITKMNVVPDIFNLAANFLYLKHTKSSNYPLEYNRMNTNKNQLQYSKKSNSTFNLIQA